MEVSGLQLAATIASSAIPVDDKLATINQLKSHVKRDYVDLDEVPAYFDGLLDALTSSQLAEPALVVMSHLIRRVLLQDKTLSVLASVGTKAIPTLVRYAGKPRGPISAAANTALEAYWLLCPDEVDAAAVSGLAGSEPEVLGSVLWLARILSDVSPHYNLDPFQEALVKQLSAPMLPAVSSAVASLMVSYYQQKHNRGGMFAFEQAMTSANVPGEVRDEIMRQILEASGAAPQSAHANSSSISQDTHHEIEPPAVPSSEYDPVTVPAALTQALSSVNCELDELITAMNVHLARDLRHKFEAMQPWFEAKETEQNWTHREKSMAQLRRILRGNASVDYPDELVECLKEHFDGICKSIGSLRTTLCVQGCLVVKDATVILREMFEPVVELVLPQLLKLCGATKLMAHSNANMAICTLWLTQAFAHRNMARILAAAQEKVVLPRHYSAIWIQIFIVRFHNHPQFSHAYITTGMSGIDVCNKLISKLLGDVNPNVRLAAKEAFFIYERYFERHLAALEAKFEPKIAKALQRSRPGSTALSTALSRAPSAAGTRTSSFGRMRGAAHKPRLTRAERPPSAPVGAASRVENRTALGTRLHPGTSSHAGRSVSMVSLESKPKPDLTLEARTERKFERKPFVEATVQSLPHNDSHSTSVSHQASEDHHEANLPASSLSPAPETHQPTLASARQRPNLSRNLSHNSVDDREGSAVPKVPPPPSNTRPEEDPILRFLASADSTTTAEGVSLLKYAIIANETLPTDDIKPLIQRVSLTNPQALEPLVSSHPPESARFMDVSTYVRLLCVIGISLDRHAVSLTEAYTPSSIITTFTNLLTWVVLTSNILGSRELMMQVIRYKLTIITHLILLMLALIPDKVTINKVEFGQMTGLLLELVNVLHDTDVYVSFCRLLRTLYLIYPQLFVMELDVIDELSRRDVCELLGIALPVKESPKGTVDELSPVKFSNATWLVPNGDGDVVMEDDFTMIPASKAMANLNKGCLPKEASTIDTPKLLPPRQREASPRLEPPNSSPSRPEQIPSSPPGSSHSSPRAASSPHNGISPVGTPAPRLAPLKPEIERLFQSPEPAAVTTPSVSTLPLAKRNLNVFSRLPTPTKKRHLGSHVDGSPTRPDFGPRLVVLPSRHVDLVDDFALVSLCEDTLSTESIQTFIDRVDPLRALSNRNKPINIYEDVVGSVQELSPQKVKEYNYTDPNWFNYQLAQLSLDDNPEDEVNGDAVTSFKSICSEIANSPTNSTFVTALHLLQRPPLSASAPEYVEYYNPQGLHDLEQALWLFFAGPRCKVPLALQALVVVKQMLVNRIPLNLLHLWPTLCRLAATANPENAVESLAIAEVFDETLTGTYPTRDVLQVVVESLSTSAPQAVILLYTTLLAKVLEVPLIQRHLDTAIVAKIDASIRPFLGSDHVDVRRTSVVVYARLLRLLTVGNPQAAPEPMEVVKSMLASITPAQKKLIEYYSTL